MYVRVWVYTPLKPNASSSTESAQISQNHFFSIPFTASTLHLMFSHFVSVVDAQAKFQPGRLELNRVNIGDYDECLDIRPPNKNFTGQYCLVSMNDTADEIDFTYVGFQWFR